MGLVALGEISFPYGASGAMSLESRFAQADDHVFDLEDCMVLVLEGQEQTENPPVKGRVPSRSSANRLRTFTLFSQKAMRPTGTGEAECVTVDAGRRTSPTVA